MNARDIAAGTFLFVLGAATAFAIAYRKEIRLYLKLEKEGVPEAVGQLADAGKILVNQFQQLRGKA